jgi:hypothetical protein
VQVYDADGRSMLAEVVPDPMPAAASVSSVRVRARRCTPKTSRSSGTFIDDVRIDAIDPSTVTIVQSVRPTGDFTGGLFPDAMISAPEAPTARANVDNRTVTITWDAVEHAGDYQLEAGSRPGARDIVTSTLVA